LNKWREFHGELWLVIGDVRRIAIIENDLCSPHSSPPVKTARDGAVVVVVDMKTNGDGKMIYNIFYLIRVNATYPNHHHTFCLFFLGPTKEKAAAEHSLFLITNTIKSIFISRISAIIYQWYHPHCEQDDKPYKKYRDFYDPPDDNIPSATIFENIF
jgi:hypothetical protein